MEEYVPSESVKFTTTRESVFNVDKKEEKYTRIEIEEDWNLGDSWIQLDEDIEISEDQIRNVVRNTIESLPKETINSIINEELKRVVLDRLSSAQISISSLDNKE